MTIKNNAILAINGGDKTINNNLGKYVWPIINSNIDKKVLQQLHTSISIYDRSGIFKEFEESFASYHQRKYAVLCSSGTLALHSVYVAAELKTGDEVICPAYTFFATVTPLLFTGAKPILCDCDDNGNIDANKIEKLITPKTKAVMVTHMWGFPASMDKIVSICKNKKLFLFEDCSHAHGARYNNQVVGSFGDIAAWSIQGPKNITGGEGGILVTNNEDFYYKTLLLGHYNKRCKQEIPKTHKFSKYSTTGMGLKYRAHPLAVTIANELFKNIDITLKIRQKYYSQIIKQLKNVSGLSTPKISDKISISGYALIFQYHSEELGGLTREKFVEALHEEGLIEIDIPNSTSPLNLLPLFQKPADIFPQYAKSFGYNSGDFPNAEKYFNQAIKMPLWSRKSDVKVVNLYIKGIKKVINNYKSLL